MQTPVHEVPHEEIVREWWFASDSKQLQQVEELPMNIAADLNNTTWYCDGRLDFDDIALLREDLFRLEAQGFDFAFSELLALLERFDLFVEFIEVHHCVSN